MKKLLALFASAALLATVTGCPSSATTPPPKKGTSEKGETVKTEKTVKTPEIAVEKTTEKKMDTPTGKAVEKTTEKTTEKAK